MFYILQDKAEKTNLKIICNSNISENILSCLALSWSSEWPAKLIRRPKQQLIPARLKHPHCAMFHLDMVPDLLHWLQPGPAGLAETTHTKVLYLYKLNFTSNQDTFQKENATSCQQKMSLYTRNLLSGLLSHCTIHSYLYPIVEILTIKTLMDRHFHFLKKESTETLRDRHLGTLVLREMPRL